MSSPTHQESSKEENGLQDYNKEVRNVDGLEVVHVYEAPEVYQSSEGKIVTDSTSQYNDQHEHQRPIQYDEKSVEREPETFCGLRKRTFWILVIALVVIVGAAVGGGLGGSLHKKTVKDNR